MTVIDKTNRKAQYALNRLPSCQEALDECSYEQSMVHGEQVANPVDSSYVKKVIEYNLELEKELKALFQIDSVEYAVKNQLPY